VAARRRTSARTAVLPARRGVPEIGRLAPSGKSILLGLALLLLAIGGYAAARETSLFAVQSVEVQGGTPAIRAQVRAALAGEVGQSLLRVDGDTIERRLGPIPTVHAFHFDRAFPHTLRVVVQPEVPLLVLRQADKAFLVAASGRVIRPLAHPRLSGLPRLWVTKDVHLAVGQALPPPAAAAPAALAPLRGASLPSGVHSVRVAAHTLTLELGSGLEVRLGDTGDLRLKLAIARRILRAAVASGEAAGYLDVSLPERPVLGLNPQVGG
jgi:cell division septal protein FtsQ